MYVNESQRVPPFHFSALCDIFKKILKFYFVPSRETVIFQSYRAWKAHFGCLESVFKPFHEYVLSIFRKLCASWALDIAPTLDVPVLFFFRQTTDLIAYVPLFTDFTLAHMYSSVLGLRWIQRSRVRVLALARNFFEQFFCHCATLSIFFGTVRLFSKLFFVAKGSPLHFFDILQQTGFSKSIKGPPFNKFKKLRFFEP